MAAGRHGVHRGLLNGYRVVKRGCLFKGIRDWLPAGFPGNLGFGAEGGVATSYITSCLTVTVRHTETGLSPRIGGA